MRADGLDEGEVEVEDEEEKSSDECEEERRELLARFGRGRVLKGLPVKRRRDTQSGQSQKSTLLGKFDGEGSLNGSDEDD